MGVPELACGLGLSQQVSQCVGAAGLAGAAATEAQGLPLAVGALSPDPRRLWQRAPSPGCSPSALPERHLEPERLRMDVGFVSL